jgi:hypothetical protein
MKELLADVEEQLNLIQDQAEKERLRRETVFGIFVVHNKYVQCEAMGSR